MRGRVGREGGFTYLGLVILVTVIGLVGAATLKVDALLRRAQAEEELLEVGAAFGAALRTYAEATPKGQPQQPPTLRELLKDPRFPGVRRHLRKIFIDPLTGKAEWGIVWANPGDKRGVLAVYSLSRAKPLKQANFDARFSGFENKRHISDWKFAATGQALAQAQIQGLGPGRPAMQPAQQGAPSLFQQAPADAPPEQPSLFPAQGANQGANQPGTGRPARPELDAGVSVPAAPVAPAAPVPAAEPAPVGKADDGDREEQDDESAPPVPPGERQAAPPVTWRGA